MSESDKKYNEPISEDSAKDGTVEAFEDFEMAGENTEEIPDVTVETDDFTENTDTPVEELIEESADDASDEAGPEEIADDASDEAESEETALALIDYFYSSLIFGNTEFLESCSLCFLNSLACLND